MTIISRDLFNRWLVAAAVLAGVAGQTWAYPIDGYAETGIARLEGYRLASEGKVAGNRLQPGALLNTGQIQLRLQHEADLRLPEADPGLTRKIVALLGAEAKYYSVSVLDLSDPDHPVFAEHNGLTRRNPGSVGKLMVALAVFQALADIYPDDIEARIRVLRDTQVTADAFIRTDHHDVPFWKPELNRMPRRELRAGDTANLWSFLDWALSASSNAAASMVIKQLLLLRHFGAAYPVSSEQEAAFFTDTKATRTRRAAAGQSADAVDTQWPGRGQPAAGQFLYLGGQAPCAGNQQHCYHARADALPAIAGAG